MNWSDEQVLRVLRRICCLLFILAFPSVSISQIPVSPPRFSAHFLLTPSDTTLELSHQFIVQGSDSLILDSLFILERDRDYRIDYRRGLVHIDSTAFFTPNASRPNGFATTHRIVLFYAALPLTFRDEYARRTIVELRDTAAEHSVRVAKPSAPLNLDTIFGPNLSKSGSIVRGFSVATNQDLSLNSGFRMQLSGQLAPNVDITAALTDENTPIQPEGNTQTLREIDKVFVEVRSGDLSATLGDYQLSFGNAEFGRFDRKLQGAKGIASYRAPFAQGTVTVSAATTEGKFTTNQFQGLEGVQGPYRLVGQNNERAIIVIAGTERVYVDGELTTRGETSDYIVDYGSGEITFMARRLITGASRIVVDFEYTERNYPRNLLGTHVSSSLASNKVRWSALFIREGDDEDSPTNLSFSDADRQVLAQSGDDRLRASMSGVAFVGRDSLTGIGRGQYAIVDTVIEGNRYRMYKFVEVPDSTAVYTVFFSDVGRVPLDSLGYDRASVGRFRAAGLGKGRYLPIRTLPLAQLHQVADLSLAVEAVEGFTISGELALSDLDENRLSGIDDGNNAGTARKLGLRWKSPELQLGSMRLGVVELSLFERNIGGAFVPIDRMNEIEFNRKWNIEQQTKTEETIREGNLFYRPREGMLFMAGIGRMKRGSSFRSTRAEARTKLSGPKRPSVDYLLELIRSENGNIGSDAQWARHKGFFDHRIGKLTPGFRLEVEDKETRSLEQNTLQEGSFRYAEYAPRLIMTDVLGMTFQSEFEWRTDDIGLDGRLERESSTFTHSYGWRLSRWQDLSSAVDVTFRRKKYEELLKQRGQKDIETVLLRMQTKYAPLNRGIDTDLYYEVATERSSKLDRVFVQVRKGLGQYSWVDGNGNGVIDRTDPVDFKQARFDGDWILLTLATEDFVPVIDLKTSLRFRLTPKRFVGTTDHFWRKLASSISTETYVRVEEKSTESDFEGIYLLHFSRFQDENTTLSGSTVFTQDIYLFEESKELSLRARFNQRKGLTQFSAATERSLGIERSLRLRSQLIAELSNQIDVLHRRDRIRATPSSNRERDIVLNSLASEFSYRPEQDVEVGFRVEVGRSEDRFPAEHTVADLNAQSIRVLYSFRGKGQARAELAREEATLSRGAMPSVSAGPLFELTGGRPFGRTWLWRTALDYRVGQFIQVSMAYEGRSESSRKTVHSARSEVRAFF